MKKIFLFLSVLFSHSMSHAYWDTVEIYSSCFTVTNEGPIVIPNTPPGTIFKGVVIGSSSVGGFIDVINSSGIAGSTIATVSLQSAEPVSVPFNIVISSGLTYKTRGNVGGVVILYKKVR